MGNRENRWLPGVAENLGHYVYLLIDPRDDHVFYVGKGTGNRCFNHIVEARKTTADSRADYQKLKTIRKIEKAGHSVRIEVLRHGLDDATALVVEGAAIDLLGIAGLENRVAGHGTADLGRMGVDDINAEYGAKPVRFLKGHKIVLIRITGLHRDTGGDNPLYERTRMWWRIAARRRNQGDASAPDYAMAVYQGVVRAVYRIEGWEPARPGHIAKDPKREGRWIFRGRRDPEMERRYLFRDVTAVLPKGLQSPLRFVGC